LLNIDTGHTSNCYHEILRPMQWRTHSVKLNAVCIFQTTDYFYTKNITTYPIQLKPLG
jgi:hypothetical protein